MKFFIYLILISAIFSLSCSSEEENPVSSSSDQGTVIRLEEDWNLGLSGDVYYYQSGETNFLALSMDTLYFSRLSNSEIYNYDKDSADWFIEGTFSGEDSEGWKTTNYKKFDLPLGEYSYLLKVDCDNIDYEMYWLQLGGDNYEFLCKNRYVPSYEVKMDSAIGRRAIEIKEGKNKIIIIGPSYIDVWEGPDFLYIPPRIYAIQE